MPITKKLSPVPTRNSPTKAHVKAPATRAGKVIGITRYNDVTLGWVERDYPQLEAWRLLAVEWLRGEPKGVAQRLGTLVAFLEKYLVGLGLPLDPAVFLARRTVLPEFYKSVCADTKDGIKNNNTLRAFLGWVLMREFSLPDDFDRPLLDPAFHNPVAFISGAGMLKLDASVHSPLPYGYIVELRRMLAAGPNFGDWRWVQNAVGVEQGKTGNNSPDWIPVTTSQIDRDDPDCVWRLRQGSARKDDLILEMWSPVRWVALLIKLLLPLRTNQVRMLDSGEADTWAYDAGSWVLNTHRLAEGSERRPLQQGVFRRADPLNDGEATSCVLYINTNKTRDIGKSGADLGYVVPWPHQEVLYWLEKLRNWQKRYNPILRRTSWSELDSRHIEAKSEVQLASYPDACFLFRLPEARVGEQHLPVSDSQLQPPWFALLKAFELRLANRSETHQNGSQIRFLPSPEQRKAWAYTTLFPLHSLRVSLITALALEGQLPFPILQRLVGHSRLLMTLYYTKPGAAHIRDALADAAERLEAYKDASIQDFLLNTEYDQLLKEAICNSTSSLAAAIPEHPAARNPAGWMPMHHGLCLVGGNTSELEGNSRVGGCYNGGLSIGTISSPKYLAVPGGSRNCVRCRWFVTSPKYREPLRAHFNSLDYHFCVARDAYHLAENAMQEFKKEKADAEDAGRPFAKLEEYRRAERMLETALKRCSDLAEDQAATWSLVKRSLAVPAGDGTQLVAAGTIDDVRVAFEETDSELLQIAGVCENVEIYPDLEPGKAVIRRSQLLDSMLYRDSLPPVFMMLSEPDQLRLGNEFMRSLARQMNPENPELGQREVISLMDASASLSQHLSLDLAALVPMPAPMQAQSLQAAREDDE